MTDLMFTQDVVTEITSSVWRAFLTESDDISPVPVVPSDALLTGTVFISGQWNGLVSLTCSSLAAVRAAALMFDAEIEEVGRADVLDAVGELVNIVGGNLKGMLPSPTGLSLPSVTDGSMHVDHRAGLNCWLTCNCPGWASPSPSPSGARMARCLLSDHRTARCPFDAVIRSRHRFSPTASSGPGRVGRAYPGRRSQRLPIRHTPGNLQTSMRDSLWVVGAVSGAPRPL